MDIFAHGLWVGVGAGLVPLLGWWSHIVIDVFTQSADFYPSSVLYPITQRGFDGLAEHAVVHGRQLCGAGSGLRVAGMEATEAASAMSLADITLCPAPAPARMALSYKLTCVPLMARSPSRPHSCG